MAALAAAIVGLVDPPQADAQQPTRDYVAVTNASTQTFTVPLFQNGTLEKVDLWRFSPAVSTVTVSQVELIGAITVTNQIAVIISSGGTNTAIVTNTQIMPGDRLLFTPAATATGTVAFVRKVGP